MHIDVMLPSFTPFEATTAVKQGGQVQRRKTEIHSKTGNTRVLETILIIIRRNPIKTLSFSIVLVN